MTAAPHILVFDSGAGGLSVAQNLLETLPKGFRLSYLADRGAFPYGEKAADFLIAHVCQLLGDFIDKHKPDLVVIACNTASTIALPALRKHFSCPFVGVVPAIKPAAQMSRTRCIGVLATPATVNRQYTNELIQSFAPDCEVLLHGSDALVQCAERFLQTHTVDTALLTHELSHLFSQQKNKEMDTIVLACTHFPLIARQLQHAAPSIRHWVDSGPAIARRVHNLLEIDTEPRRENSIDIYLSANAIEDTQIDTLTEAYRQYLMG